jgi:hypothetical protein
MPLADAVVVETGAQVDQALRPQEGEEISVVRPRGEILVLESAGADALDGEQAPAPPGEEWTRRGWGRGLRGHGF